MSRLVIISNRVADLRAATQTGGLAVALADALRQRGGIWFGWNGERHGVTGGDLAVAKIGKVETVAAPLSPHDVDDYYFGFSNSVLWPLCHYRLDLVDYRPSFSDAYQRVNQIFASQLVPFLKPDDLIWSHDYHLIPLAGYLRQLGCRQRMGFFLHIPFPPPDLIKAVPDHAELISSLLEYDVIGFQTHSDAENFKLCLGEKTIAVQIAEDQFRVGERTIIIDRFPIGIDVAAFTAMAEKAEEDVKIDLMRRQVLDRRQIIGVERLDYSKGLPERMKAFERLLMQHPELEKTVTFLQIASPTREKVDAYADIRMELEALAGAINGRFSDFNWTPVRYIHRPVSRHKLAPLFRGSQVGLVTPLRDGMNLVAKEYIAAQNPDDPGVLVLSKFAGAAEEMRQALIVNPYDIDDMAQQLHRALTMTLKERQRRFEALHDQISRYDAREWLDRFLKALKPANDLANGKEPASLIAARTASALI